MRNMKILIGVAVTALLLGALAIGFTAPGAEGVQHQCGPNDVSPEQFVAQYDADKSGTLSQDEFPGPEHAFARVDADGNGQITVEEAVAAEKTRHERRGMQGAGGAATMEPQARWERLLEHADADGNGVISQDEFNGPEHAFARLDANQDGQITQEETLAVTPRQGRQAGEAGMQRGNANPEQGWQRMLERHDADKSGTISQDEFMGRDEVFDAIDANDDGQISEDELGQAAQQFRQRRGARMGGGQGANAGQQ